MLLQSILANILPASTLWTGYIKNPVLNHDTEAFIYRTLAEYGSPGGISIAVVRRDAHGKWNVETRGYGVATLDGDKVTEDTLFSIGSNSKLFNVFATGLLIHNETLSPRLSWTTPLASVIPGFDLEDPVAAKEATILDAMSHRTGLPNHDESIKNTDDVLNTIKKLKYQRPAAGIRDIYQYNNNMYTLLSYIPTAVLRSDISYGRYVKQHILDPLDMTSTTFSFEAAKTSGRMAHGMARQNLNFGNGSIIPRSFPYWSPFGNGEGNLISGAAGLISNARDMAIWLQTLLLEGKNPRTNVSVIPAEVVRKAAEGVVVSVDAALYPELSPVVYGAGQARGTYRGHEYIVHTGQVPGWKSEIIRLPWDHLGIALFSNDQDVGSALVRTIRYRLLDEALGLEPVDWTSRLKHDMAPFRPPSTPRPADATFPLGKFSSLAGKYDNLGYGPFELCLVWPENPSASPYCKELAANMSTILPGATVPGVPTFFAHWNTPWFSHMRISHFNGTLFNVTCLTSIPTYDPKEPFWTHDPLVEDEALAFVDEKLGGIGFHGLWGADTGVGGTTMRNRAEVWFEKVVDSESG